MKSLIVLFLLSSFVCHAQTDRPNYCKLLEIVFNDDSTKMLLKIDAYPTDKFILVDTKGVLTNCGSIELRSNAIPLEIYKEYFSTPREYYDIIAYKKDNYYVIGIAYDKKHTTLRTFFSKKGNTWVIVKRVKGVL